MPRSIWNGTITFGLIAVPVKVHSAVEDRTVHFHQVHAPDGARIEQHRFCTQEDRQVPYSEVVKGYEVSEGEYVVLTKDEVAAAAGEGAHVIEIEQFVCQAEIDPVFYDHTYHLGVREEEDAYRLLHDALKRSDRVGLGRWVFHNREYLVAVRALGAALALHTMRFADELVTPSDLEIPEPSRQPADREIEMASMLVDSLHAPFKPDSFKDAYRERVLAMIEAKAAGREPDLPEPEPEQDSGDLMAALEASLKASGKRSTTKKSTVKNSTAKKTTAKKTTAKAGR